MFFKEEMLSNLIAQRNKLLEEIEADSKKAPFSGWVHPKNTLKTGIKFKINRLKKEINSIEHIRGILSRLEIHMIQLNSKAKSQEDNKEIIRTKNLINNYRRKLDIARNKK